MSLDSSALPRPLSLLIIRHAEAEPASAATRDADDVRALTERGRRQAKYLAFALRALGYEPRVFLTSPLVRARQTAAQLRENGFLAAPIEILDTLRPGKFHPERLLRGILQACGAGHTGGAGADGAKGQPPAPAVVPASDDRASESDRNPFLLAIVGHQPELGQLILELLAPPNPDVTAPAAGGVSTAFSLRKGSAFLLTWRATDDPHAPPTVEMVIQPRHAKAMAALAAK